MTGKAARSILLALAAIGLLGGCGYPPPPGQGSAATAGEQPTTPTPVPGAFKFDDGRGKRVTTFPDGLQIVDIAVGSGPIVHSGDTISVNYTGWLSNGQQFDSSLDRGQPFQVAIGNGQVIPGWDEGIPSMRVGGRRRLTIPPALGYGAQGSAPVIPPNATLVFELRVEAIVTPAPSPGASPSASPSPSPRPS